ncbi:MAG TPA: ABC transporter permease [Acetomicrobium flavidum]|uniref:Permease component of ribose/xylose/arabinose/galactoside ABC-type transporters n=2 Tax=Acetomicrobium TaxID=49894 RepID=I4BU69_ACEMN|nr:ABC transporter [Acetomicrobium mobile]SIN66784.1 monosaccharide ABC transporter membrane protein, CUT2 family [Acetomicrobium flavidum]AFM20826.1 permease component of ribose/xylose/arabinose/galactoside ABC-type transporters [Acetomicrobium mobile DSM 13181]HOJ82875.1 ABC transporter permease [Acetomicrobium flavidum]HOM31768.1 ABC transporter permease [Acetomicrobium flavidum]HOP88375.1 ABC transporter permease [Acetomicrobium flavidum]
MDRIKKFIIDVGWPRAIIALFLLSLFILAPFVNVRIDSSINDTLIRFGMNGILVLAMVPMVQSGCGLNFGLPLGIIAGLLGATISLEMNATGFIGFLVAIAMATPFAVIFGWGYGQLLNKVKGGEMMIATYVGFSSVAFMCIMWLLLPFKNPSMVWGYAGKGLRTTISVQEYWGGVLNNFLSIRLTQFFSIPTGTLLFFALMSLLLWAFFRTKTGNAISAVGANPDFARAAGINIDKMRTLSVILSTLLGAIGIIVYEQSFGFIQLYMGPFYMAFPSVAAILLGGASINRATLTHVIIGTFLFQGILTMTPSVINSMLQTDMSEVIRIIVSNGMILYALTRGVRVKSR